MGVVVVVMTFVVGLALAVAVANLVAVMVTYFVVVVVSAGFSLSDEVDAFGHVPAILNCDDECSNVVGCVALIAGGSDVAVFIRFPDEELKIEIVDGGAICVDGGGRSVELLAFLFRVELALVLSSFLVIPVLMDDRDVLSVVVKLDEGFSVLVFETFEL